MRRRSPVLRRLVKVSAVALGAGLVVTGCAPVKMGAAAIAGNQRITIATLDTEVSNLSQAVKLYPGIISLSAAQQTQDTLSWLIRFQINEELARQAGLTVTTAQAQTALAQAYAVAKANAQSQGLSNVSLDLILAANGIPPNKSFEVGRYQAIVDQFIGHPGSRRPALQLRGQREGGLPERHAVKRGRSSLPGGCHPGSFGQICFFFPLDLVPVALDLIGAGDGHVPEHVRMPPYQLGHDPVGDIVDREPGVVVTLGRDARVEHHLQQHIAEFLTKSPLITGLKSLEGLVWLLQQMRCE